MRLGLGLSLSGIGGAGEVSIENQTAPFGALTLASSGGFKPVTSGGAEVDLIAVTDQGTTTRTWSVSGGRLVADGTPAVDDGKVITCSHADGAVDLTISSIADTYSVGLSNSEIRAALTAIGSTGGKDVLLRRGTFEVPRTTFRDWDFDAEVVIEGETGSGGARDWLTKLTSTGTNFPEFRAADNVTLRSINFESTDADGVPVATNGCDNFIIEDCRLAGLALDPMGDYSAEDSYDNIMSCVRDLGGTKGALTIRRCLLENAGKGVIWGGFSGAFSMTDNVLRYLYEDGSTLTISGAAQLTAGITVSRNVFYGSVGKGTDHPNPHTDALVQFNITHTSGDLADVEIEQNIVWLEPSTSRNLEAQVVFSNQDSTDVLFSGIRVCGNIFLANHQNCVLLEKTKNPVVVGNIAAKADPTITSAADQPRISVGTEVSEGADGVVAHNVAEAFSIGGGTGGGSIYEHDNVTLGDSGATIPYPNAFDGPTFPPTTRAEVLTKFATKTGGPVDTADAGPLSGYATFGDVYDSAGFALDSGYEAVAISPPTTLTIAEQGLPVYDTDPHDAGVATITLSGTHDSDGSTLQYQLHDESDDSVVVAWTDFVAGSSGAWEKTITRAPSFTRLYAAVRAKGDTDVNDTQSNAWQAGYIAAWMGQSLIARPLSNNTTGTLTPPANALWLLDNDDHGTTANGPEVIDGSSPLSLRRMAATVSALSDGPLCIVDMTLSGTSRSEFCDDAKMGRDWDDSGAAAVKYIRDNGSDCSIVLDHWFTSDAATSGEFKRMWAPFYLRQQIGGVGNTDDASGVQDYADGEVGVVPSREYYADHFLYDLSSAGDSGLFDKDRTKWVPMFGASHWASGTRSDGAFNSTDEAKGELRQALRDLADSDSDYSGITLRSVSGWTGPASFGGHMAQPDNSHVASPDVDGEPLVGVYLIIATLRGLAVMGNDEPVATSASWASDGSYVDVTFTLPHGGDLSTAAIEYAAGSYDGTFEASTFVASTGSIDALKEVQGFSIVNGSTRTFEDFTAEIQDAANGIVRITPDTAFVNGDTISFGHADGHNLLNATDVANGRPHSHWPLETRTHVSGTGYGYPAVREPYNLALFTASGIADAVAPTLSGISVAKTSTTADLSWSTDEDNGTAYWMVDQNASRTAAQVKAGGGADSGNVSVSSSGAQTDIEAMGLTASTAYYFHLMHEDAATNQSTVSSTSFTTSAAATPSFTTGSGGPYFGDTSSLGSGIVGLTARATIKSLSAGASDQALFFVSGLKWNVTLRAAGEILLQLRDDGNNTVVNKESASAVTFSDGDTLTASFSMAGEYAKVWKNSSLIIDETFTPSDADWSAQSSRDFYFLAYNTGATQTEGSFYSLEFWKDPSSTDDLSGLGAADKTISGNAATVNADPWKLGDAAT